MAPLFKLVFSVYLTALIASAGPELAKTSPRWVFGAGALTCVSHINKENLVVASYPIESEKCDATKVKFEWGLSRAGALVCGPSEVYGKPVTGLVKTVDTKYCATSAVKARWGLNSSGKLGCMPTSINGSKILPPVRGIAESFCADSEISAHWVRNSDGSRVCIADAVEGLSMKNVRSAVDRRFCQQSGPRSDARKSPSKTESAR